MGLNTIPAVGPLKLQGVSRGGCLSVCVRGLWMECLNNGERVGVTLL